MSTNPDFDLMREGFIPETRDLLETANTALLSLESDPGDTNAVNALFRSVHTIKGTAGMFDVPMLVQLVHAAEDLLGAVRDGKLALNAWIVDDMLDCFDHVARWIDALDDTGTLPPDSGEIARTRAARYRSYLADDAQAPVEMEAAAMAGPLPAWIDDATRADMAAAIATADDAATLVAVRYEPLEDCFFNGEDPLFLARQMPDALWTRIEPRTPWAPAAEFDPYHCNLRFAFLSSAPREEIEHLLRYVLRETEIAVITAADLRRGADAGAEIVPFRDAQEDPLLPVAREVLAAQARLFEAGDATTRTRATALTVRNALTAIGAAFDPDDLDRQIESGIAQRSATPFKAFLASVLEPAAEGPQPGSQNPAATRAKAETTERALKVEPAKIDALVNLVGELIVAKNALPFLARRAETVYGSRELAREIKDQYGVVDRIAQDLQGAVMGIRMLPVSEMFKRFPRLVRDISRKLEKNVELVIEGETTEADKNVIEALADPLVHVVRNSLDHGIETPEERRAAGKSEKAKVLLKASQEGDSVVIEIADDGRGIDPERIKAKAVEKGVIDAERAAQLSDAEAVQLVFFPGFSTAEQVSDLSGRGVGMDVVRSTVESLGGSAALTSTLGSGSTVRLKLPLSMAVTHVMTVEAGGQLFGIPMDAVAETVRIRRDRIRRFKRAEAFVLREALVPIVRLRALLAMERRDVAEEAVLVVRIAGAPVGLLVDEFSTGMEVILKPLGGILDDMPGYSGTAVLGDGKVLLVLNVKELI